MRAFVITSYSIHYTKLYEAGNATVDLTGDITTASSQGVVISKDGRNALAGSGGGDDFSIVDALSLFGAAGSPTPAALGGCA